MPYGRTALRVILLLTTVSLTGCFSSNPKDIEAFLRPHEVDVTAKEYVLMPPDEIEVHCSEVPEIHLQRQQIRPDGKISFEGLGEIEAAGKTPEEVSSIVAQKASELYALAEDHAVDARVVTFRSKMFYVLGEVSYPGPKIYTGRDSVLSALAQAQPTVLAWKDHIQVIRPSGNKDEKPKVFEVNFNRMFVHGDASKDVLLQEGDIIFAPPTVLASIAKVIEEFTRPISSAFSTVYVVQRAQMMGAAGGRGYGGY